MIHVLLYQKMANIINNKIWPRLPKRQLQCTERHTYREGLKKGPTFKGLIVWEDLKLWSKIGLGKGVIGGRGLS